MLAEALQAEVDAYIARFADLRDDDGRQLVVRNGYHQPREVTTCAGAVAVNAPHLVALVRAGAKFDDGKLVERPETAAA